MKKEKVIKAHTRRLKSGKVITVKTHKAKYDAADLAAQKDGAGKELLEKKEKNSAVLNEEFSDKDFKEWYKFNDWDLPRKEWPEVVRKVDDSIKASMSKSQYNKFCAKIDESWSPRGHSNAFIAYLLLYKQTGKTKSKPVKPKVNKEAIELREHLDKGEGVIPTHLSKAMRTGDENLVNEVKDRLKKTVIEGINGQNGIFRADETIKLLQTRLKLANLEEEKEALNWTLNLIKKEKKIKQLSSLGRGKPYKRTDISKPENPDSVGKSLEL